MCTYSWKVFLTIEMWVSASLLQLILGSPDANRLYGDLMRDYNKLIRPVVRNTDILTVFFGIKFIQLINVDEVNQVITTNVIVRQSWVDYKLAWHPDNYGGIEQMDVLSNSIWTPDIVLYNK
ncbi:hypothetical protein RvY_03018-3 [Ramazzottius varieornatus]|uniref:Neurotransmitter-gated ion-channel ligand-binding domain-containing protein n=1 Tax=Ramazzottius varieornatus TaxID=947166 RepID=A0A1D1UWU9_RAMVA|nr:hypothetical protein RvY_03018-3 [Ramazzottius varieornatus]